MFDDKIMFANYWGPMAKYEDEWDKILQTQCGFVEEGETANPTREEKWIYEVRKAESTNIQKHDKEMANDRAIAARMIEILDKETELAKQEGQKVVRGRKSRPIRDRWLK